jgi:hypothetical protein
MIFENILRPTKPLNCDFCLPIPIFLILFCFEKSVIFEASLLKDKKTKNKISTQKCAPDILDLSFFEIRAL